MCESSTCETSANMALRLVRMPSRSGVSGHCAPPRARIHAKSGFRVSHAVLADSIRSDMSRHRPRGGSGCSCNGSVIVRRVVSSSV